MSSLEPKIQAWKAGMSASGFPSGDALDELESHLREDVARSLGAGVSPEDAFEAAKARIGHPRAVQVEFARGGSFSPVALASGSAASVFNLCLTGLGFFALCSVPVVMLVYPEYSWFGASPLVIPGFVGLFGWAIYRLAQAWRRWIRNDSAGFTHRDFEFGCILAAVLSLALVPLLLEDFVWTLAGSGLTREGIAAGAAVIFCVAALGARWSWTQWCVFWNSQRCRGTAARVSRTLCVYHGPILVGLFYLMWAAKAFSEGFWPPPIGMFDPKGSLPSLIIHWMIFGWAFLAPVAVAGSCVHFWVALRRFRHGAVGPMPGAATTWEEVEGRAREVVATVLLMGVAVVYFALDPNGLYSWFLD